MAERRIGVFVDVQNIYYTTRQTFSRQFNYRYLWQQLSSSGEIVVANAYATQRHDSQQLKFQTALQHIGFTVKLKPYIQRQDGSAKGDWDVGITIDVLAEAGRLDQVVLLSGDGDFDLLADAVRQQQCQVRVIGVAALTANSLIAAADEFTAIDSVWLL